MAGQTINDRLLAARHSLAGQGLAKSVCKATTEEMIGPKKKHLDCESHSHDTVSIFFKKHPPPPPPPPPPSPACQPHSPSRLLPPPRPDHTSYSWPRSFKIRELVTLSSLGAWRKGDMMHLDIS
jgi:hypothetical protein